MAELLQANRKEVTKQKKQKKNVSNKPDCVIFMWVVRIQGVVLLNAKAEQFE